MKKQHNFQMIQDFKSRSDYMTSQRPPSIRKTGILLRQQNSKPLRVLKYQKEIDPNVDRYYLAVPGSALENHYHTLLTQEEKAN